MKDVSQFLFSEPTFEISSFRQNWVGKTSHRHFRITEYLSCLISCSVSNSWDIPSSAKHWGAKSKVFYCTTRHCTPFLSAKFKDWQTLATSCNLETPFVGERSFSKEQWPFGRRIFLFLPPPSYPSSASDPPTSRRCFKNLWWRLMRHPAKDERVTTKIRL